MAEQGDARLSQRPVVQVVATAVPRCLQVGGQPSGRAWQRANGRVEKACLEKPPKDVAVAEPAGHPWSPTAGQEDVTARPMELLGDLATGLAAPNHEHRAARHVRRVAVIRDVDLKQIRGEGGRSWRSVGPLVGAGAEHHCLGQDLPGRRLEQEAPVRA